TAVYVGYNHLRGPQLEMAPSPWVVIWAEDYGPPGVVLSIMSEMTYLNTADPGYNAAIQYEFAEFTFNGKKYRFVGRAQVLFDNPRSDPNCATAPDLSIGKVVELEDRTRIFGCLSKDDRKLRIQKEKKISRFVLGASGTSNETDFSPTFVECQKDEP